MARQTTKNHVAAERYMRMTRYGPMADPQSPYFDHDYDNNKELTWSNYADTVSVKALKVDLDDKIQIDRQAILGAREVITFPLDLAASQATQTIFIAKRVMTIIGITEIHGTANGATLTAYISKDTGTSAPGAGYNTMTNTFNLNGTANTLQSATLAAVKPNGDPNAYIVLAIGDRLAIKLSTTLTSLAGLQITLICTPGYKENFAIYRMNANGSIATQGIFVALRDTTITGVSALWSTAGTNGGTVTVDVTKETSTTASGSGTSVLAAALSVKTTANTVANPALTSTASLLSLVASDRLSVKLTGTLTALAGLVVIVYFAPSYTYVDIGFNLLANASLVDQTIFTADRDYEIAEVVEVHGTAGTDGGGVTLTIGISRGTTAPGSGTQALTTTFDMKSTAYTPVFLGGTTLLHTRLIPAGARVDLNFNGTTTALANLQLRMALIPR